MSSTNKLGKYQITREIARSNDIVYEAIDPGLGRRIALKELCLPPNLTGAQKRERIERFHREWKAAVQVQHPNIVTIYDAGQDGDRFYIAMEYLEGQTLREVMQMQGALPVQQAIDITLQLCAALSYAHGHNVVHRDIKPENVQVLPGGHVKLTDFGIAKVMTDPSITANGQVFGTPSYMSPEQVSGKPIDGRSDLFSLGVMLYEMLTGHKPFTGDSVVTITYNIMNAEPAQPVGVPPHLSGVIRKAMSKDPGMRYSTADQMAEDIKNPTASVAAMFSDPFPTAQPTGFGGTPPTTFAPPPMQSPAPQPSAIPDPFAQVPPPPMQQSPFPNAPGPQGAQMPQAPPPYRRAGMSAETKSFLGLLLVAVGLVGMLFFAVWTVNQAYAAYADKTALQITQKYVNQGDKLLHNGDINAAIDQYNSGVRAAGKSKPAGKLARERLASAYVEIARQRFIAADYSAAAQKAQLAVQSDPDYPAGHYYLGASSFYLHNFDTAETELKITVDKGGNDEFALAARPLLARVYIQNGDTYRVRGQMDAAKEAYKAAVDLQDPQTLDAATKRLQDMGG